MADTIKAATLTWTTATSYFIQRCVDVPCSSCSPPPGRCCRLGWRSPARSGPPGWASAGCSTGPPWGRSTPPASRPGGRSLRGKGYVECVCGWQTSGAFGQFKADGINKPSPHTHSGRELGHAGVLPPARPVTSCHTSPINRCIGEFARSGQVRQLQPPATSHTLHKVQNILG